MKKNKLKTDSKYFRFGFLLGTAQFVGAVHILCGLYLTFSSLPWMDYTPKDFKVYSWFLCGLGSYFLGSYVFHNAEKLVADWMKVELPEDTQEN
jgi:TRAP-type uncharacterized transport system fused permease subunit